MMSPGVALGAVELGVLITWLSNSGALPGALIAIEIDGEYFRPIKPASYRGYYQDLALDYEPGYRSVREFEAELCGLMNQTMEGYKGGIYAITSRTGVWVSHMGQASGIFVKGIRCPSPGCLILTTGRDAD